MSIELDNVTSGYNLSAINKNFQTIESKMNDEVLWRASSTVAGEAKMERDLDMDGYRILNADIDGSSITNDHAIRVPRTEGPIEPLAEADIRKGKVLGFHPDTGLPTVFIPASGSAADVLMQLASTSGGSMIGLSSGETLQEFVDGIEAFTFESFGGSVSDATGATNTAALKAVVASSAKYVIFNGDYKFSGVDMIFDNASGITFEGKGTTTFTIPENTFAFRSPSNLKFLNITFYSAPRDTSTPANVYFSNYSNILFRDCKFLGFGGDTTNIAGSSSLWMYAGDVDGTYVKAGDSFGATIDNCYFDGLRDRLLNFGVRIYTEFGGVSASIAKNYRNKIVNSTFVGHNWNAIEIAGPSTYSNIINSCTFTSVGLCPIDLDKGTHLNVVNDITITNLKGDLGVSGFTRASAVNIQGATSDTFFAFGNTVTNVTCTSTKTDIDAHGATGFGSGFTAVSLAYCFDNTVENVYFHCFGGRPQKGANSAIGLGAIAFETISGCTVRNVKTVNASHGISMTGPKSASMGVGNTNYFVDITNVGIIAGEVVDIYQATSGSPIKVIIDHLRMTTDGTQTSRAYNSHNYAVVYRTVGSSLNYLKIKNSVIGIPSHTSTWFCLLSGPQIALEEVYINDIDGANSVNNRFMESNTLASVVRVALNNVFVNIERSPLILQNAFAGMTGGTFSVVGDISDSGLPVSKPVTLFSTSLPTFPLASQFDGAITVRRATLVSGSPWGWGSTGSAWSAFGTSA